MATSSKKSSAKKATKKSAAKKKTKKKTTKKAAKKKAASKKKSTKKKTANKKVAKKKTAKKKTTKKTTAKKTTAKKKTAAKKTSKKPAASRGAGKQLVIVESPAKAKTINKYLGGDFVVQASVGHIRDLPARAPKGSKMPVPGVDLDNNFEPTYEVLPNKTKTVNELKKLAKDAAEVWFATDLDREGEAIAWHLAQLLEIEPSAAKRVVFNAITEEAVTRAFANPRAIDENKVNAQQARRILDRLVGYLASPLLWKKVARGLSAGRVQSVAVRLIVERERQIDVFVPDERWQVTARICSEPEKNIELRDAWAAFMGTVDDKGRPPTNKRRNAWMAEHNSLRTELHEFEGNKFSLGCASTEPRDLSSEIKRVAEAVGLSDVAVVSTEDESGKGPARFKRVVVGKPLPSARYTVDAIETRKTSSRPSAPFITSSMQIAASTRLGFATQRTMRVAQSLYEGVALPDAGQVGLITYMRTDSTNLSPEALGQIRGFVSKTHGEDFLSAKPNVFSSSNKDAQEAHEAIRPTDVNRTPESVRGSLTEEQFKLYDLIWRRTVASQMRPAQWNATSVFFARSDKQTGVRLKCTGRTLAFAGFYKVAGVPIDSDEQTLPELKKGDTLGLFTVEPEQKFSNPPPRYTEASLVKTLEGEGIGRPSTYASIIQVIQDRNYVEQLDRRFYATDLGEVVTDKLVEAFNDIMNVGYTREMEQQLDGIEAEGNDWTLMLGAFYKTFARDLEVAHENLTHAKAETQPAPYQCPKCGSPTCYRFGKNGRFLSCSAYPKCDYAAPINREGTPVLPEHVDIVCPDDGSEMELRKGRFGQFIASVNYPKTQFVINLDRKGNIKYPAIPPYVTEIECEKCGAPLNLRSGKRGPWLGCSKFPKCRGRKSWASLDEKLQNKLVKALAVHEVENPRPELRRRDGSIIPEGTPAQELALPGREVELKIHPDWDVTKAEQEHAKVPAKAIAQAKAQAQSRQAAQAAQPQAPPG